MINNINLQILHMTKCKNIGLNKNNSLHDTFFVDEVQNKVIDILYNQKENVTTNCVMDIEEFIKLLELVYNKKDHRIDIRLESKDIKNILELGLTAYNIDYEVDKLANIKNANLSINKIGIWEMDYYVKYPFHVTVTFNSGLPNRSLLTLRITISAI